jgi:chromosome partitioning protein
MHRRNGAVINWRGAQRAMHILMLAKEKGGAGASTLARELGVVAAAEGQRVVFIDLDPQASLSKWWNRRTAEAHEPPNPALATPTPDQLFSTLERLRDADAADLVIIDVPPSVHSFLLSVMRAADFILVPSRPTSDDFDALPAVVGMIEESGKRYAFALTQAPTGRRIRAVDEAIPILARQGRVAGVLRFRTAFPTAAAAGQTATEFEPDGKAAAEVRDLWGFVSVELNKTMLAAAPAYA